MNAKLKTIKPAGAKIKMRWLEPLIVMLIVAIIYYVLDITTGKESLPLRYILLALVALLNIGYGYFTYLNRKAFSVNPRLLFQSFLMILLILEACSMTICRSNNTGFTLASLRWFDKYWKPINELGYRDHPIDKKAEGKKKILVVGDSFTAGQGVNDISNRYTGLLQAKIGDQFKVYNLGMDGADTRQEYDQLTAYPVAADYIVLQYFMNDIDRTAMQNGKVFSGFHLYDDLTFSYIIQRSYFINYIFWLLPHDDLNGYIKLLDEAYSDEAIMKLHLADLRRFTAYSRERHIPLVVILFPDLADIHRFPAAQQSIANCFREEGVKVILMSEHVSGLSIPDRIINNNDLHPSLRVHAIAADLLYDYFQTGLLH